MNCCTQRQEPLIGFFLELYPWLPAAFSLYSRCRQDKAWQPKDGSELLITEMGQGHRKNLIGWLERRAKMIHTAAVVDLTFAVARHTGGEWAHDSMEEELRLLDDMDPVAFLRTLPLYRRLIR